MYDSHELIKSPYGLLNYGESKAIVGVHESLEDKHAGRLTYVEANQKIKEAYIDENGQIVKNTVMLVNPGKRNITDAYLFDNVAAVKVEKYFFVFFVRPLTANTYADYLETTNVDGSTLNIPGDVNITAWDFRYHTSGLQCFAIKGSTFYRYTFNFDKDLTRVSIKEVFVNVP